MVPRKYLMFGMIWFGVLKSATASAEAPRPVLPLNLTLRIPTAATSPGQDNDVLQSKGSRQKALTEYKAALAELNRSRGDQAKNIQQIRAAASKLGPGARLLAELTAGRVRAGVSASGAKSGKSDASYRAHLLAACNIAAKMDEKTHEEAALYAVTIWRKTEGGDSPWVAPPIDAKAQKQFAMMKAIIERQALREWGNNQKDQALRKYRALASSYNGSPDGAALDLRILEFERANYATSKSAERYQKELVASAAKYQDPQFLGAGNESRSQKVAAVVARLHKDLINDLIQKALPKTSDGADRKRAIRAIEVYLTANIPDSEKERVRDAQGEIEYNHNAHKAAAGIFAALAAESQGPKAITYWRKSIRSQKVLASWPDDAPWNEIPKGNSEARAVLIDMFRKVDSGSAKDWDTGAHIGLLLIATGQQAEALTYWTERLSQTAAGTHASMAAGWMIMARVETKQWSDLEVLGRIMVKSNLVARHRDKNFKPRDVLGMALLEGGIALIAASDHKSAITKLQEYVKGWRGDSRHDEGMYHLAQAFQGDRQFREAILALEGFTKTYPKSKLRHDALIQGGSWTLALTWDEHVIYFLESHAREFGADAKSKESLAMLADLYLGKQIYDSAMRVMTIQLARKDLSEQERYDTARRLLETAERHSSPETSMKTADSLSRQFADSPILTAIALSLKARILSGRGNLAGLKTLEKTANSIDTSQPDLADIVSEIRFLIAEANAKGKYKDEVFSLGTRDPMSTLEKGHVQFQSFIEMYRAACMPVRTSWCGPALHRAARVSEEFVAAYQGLDIAKTLDPEIVKKFHGRKKEIIESAENLTLELDEKSYELAKSGSTNPAWTTAIMWQNGGDWSSERFTSEAASHFIQWHIR